MKKTIGTFTFGIAVGLTLAYYLNVQPDQTKQSNLKVVTSAGESLSLELNSYVKLKDAEEKYKKADEILGKVMTLFLANVSIHFDQRVKKYFDSPVATRTKAEQETPKYRDVEKSKMAHEIPAPEDNDKEQGIYTSINLPFQSIENEELRGPFVRSRHQVINKPFMYFKNAKAATSKKIADEFTGEFSGVILALGGKNEGETYDVLLKVNLQHVGEKIVGTYFSELSRGGKPFSTNKGNGTNNHIKQSSSKKEYLLSTSPNSYMQLFKRDSNQYYGSFYSNDEYVGVVVINRN